MTTDPTTTTRSDAMPDTDHDTAAVLTEAERWNADWPVGTTVYAWPGVRRDETPPLVTTTRSPAWTIAGDQHIVSVEGYPGGIALNHVQVRPAPPPTPICRHGFFDTEEGHWCDEQEDRKRADQQPPRDDPQPDEREALAFLVTGADRAQLGRSAVDAIIRTYGPVADAILAAGFRRDPDHGLREVRTEYGLRDAEGTVYTGEDEGLRWTREQAEYARDVGGDGVTEDTVLMREVVVHREHVGEWSALAEPTPGSES